MQTIIKHVSTMDRAERYCSHHGGYTSAQGGVEKKTQGGKSMRWICQRCVDANDKRRLTKRKKTSMNHEHAESV